MQQKVEEMNRQVIAERLRNLQLVRKLEIVERNRNNQNVEYRKIERNYQEQRLLQAKQFKIANYESVNFYFFFSTLIFFKFFR